MSCAQELDAQLDISKCPHLDAEFSISSGSFWPLVDVLMSIRAESGRFDKTPWGNPLSAAV